MAPGEFLQRLTTAVNSVWLVRPSDARDGGVSRGLHHLRRRGLCREGGENRLLKKRGLRGEIEIMEIKEEDIQSLVQEILKRLGDSAPG